MPVIQVHPVVLLAPAFVLGAYIGYRRGWQREAITALVLALAVIVLRQGLDDILWLINGLLDRLSRVAAIIVGGDIRAAPPQITVSADLAPVAILMVLAVLVALAYFVGGRVGRHYSVSRSGRLFGMLIGSLNVFVIMSRILGSLRQVGPTPPGTAGLNIRIPAFPGADIVVPPPPDGALLVSWPLAAIVFLLVSMVVYLLVRMARV